MVKARGMSGSAGNARGRSSTRSAGETNGIPSSAGCTQSSPPKSGGISRLGSSAGNASDGIYAPAKMQVKTIGVGENQPPDDHCPAGGIRCPFANIPKFQIPNSKSEIRNIKIRQSNIEF